MVQRRRFLTGAGRLAAASGLGGTWVAAAAPTPPPAVTRTITLAVPGPGCLPYLPLALALGLILIAVVLAVNTAAFMLRLWAEKRWG